MAAPTPFRINNILAVPGPPGPPGPAGAGAIMGGDLATVDSTHQKVVGIDGHPINSSAFADKKVAIQNIATGQWDERQLSFDDIAAASSLTLAIHGGVSVYQQGALANPTFDRTFGPDGTGVTADTLGDGTTTVSILGNANPVSAPGTNYTKTTPGQSFTFTENATRNGVALSKAVAISYHEDVYYGVGTAGATGFNPTTGALIGATGTLTNAGLSTTGNVSFSPTPTNQKVYYVCHTHYGVKTLKDRNNFTITQVGAPTNYSTPNTNSTASTWYIHESLNLLSTVDGPVTVS